MLFERGTTDYTRKWKLKQPNSLKNLNIATSNNNHKYVYFFITITANTDNTCLYLLHTLREAYSNHRQTHFPGRLFVKILVQSGSDLCSSHTGFAFRLTVRCTLSYESLTIEPKYTNRTHFVCSFFTRKKQMSGAELFMWIMRDYYCKILIIFVVYTIYYVWRDKTNIKQNGVINV